MICILWSFRLRPEYEQAFVRAYDSRGDWAQLFARSAAYHGTELLREPGYPPRYLTIDRWDSAADFTNFKQQFRSEYEALDHRCEAFTEDEQLIGIFETVE